VLLGVLAVVAGGLVVPAAAGAAAQHAGDRIMVASATFADPADCADGECDAVYLTAASGVLGGGNAKVPIDGIVLVDVYPSMVTDEGPFPVDEPTVSGCTTQVDVSLARNLALGRAETLGPVELNEFVMNQDGTIECSTPTGHFLDLSAVFTGVGVISTYAGHGTYSTPWVHEVTGQVQKTRLASVEATTVLDGAQVGSVWPDSGLLIREAYRSLLVTHRVAVGPVVRGPLQVVKHAELVEIGSGFAGGWSVDAMVIRAPDGTGKTYLGINGMLGDDFCFGDSEPAPSQIVLADDLSTGTAEGTVTVYCGETGEEYGEVDVSATWTGDGDAWRFRNTGVFRSPEGSGTTRVTGIHRDATLTLVVDGDSTAGEGFLEATAFKSTPKAEIG
jgi:hypothetical protein